MNKPKKEMTHLFWASQVVLVVNNLPVNAGDARDLGSIPGWGKSLGGGWQPTPVFSPGESPWAEELGRLHAMGSRRVGHVMSYSEVSLSSKLVVGTRR